MAKFKIENLKSSNRTDTTYVHGDSYKTVTTNKQTQ